MKKVILFSSLFSASFAFAQDYSRPVINLASDGTSNATITIAEGAVFYDVNKTKSVIKGSNPLCTLSLNSSTDTQSFNQELNLRITSITGTAVNPSEEGDFAIVAIQLSKVSGAKTQKVATLTCKKVPVTEGYSYVTGNENTRMVTINSLIEVLGGNATITLAEALRISESEEEVAPKKN
jgi:hypothetical protein